MTERPRFPLVVLISGGGSNLQSIIDRIEQGLPAEIKAVISNEPRAYGLHRAERAGIETRVLNHRDFPQRESYDRALAELIESYQPELIVLAGFMRILTAAFVRRFHGRLVNIHPSLLPNYRGLHTHQRVLEAGDREHGASVHFVTEELDGGPLIIQAKVAVEAGDDADSLAARVLAKEHLIYPKAIDLFAHGRLRLDGERVMVDGEPLSAPLSLNPGTA